MIRNLIQMAVFAAAIGVLYLPVREYLLNRAVTADLKKYDYLLGDFEVVDPKKVYIRALEIDEHFHYAWRVYLPENTGIAERTELRNSGSSHTGSITSSRGIPARSFIMRLQLDVKPDEFQKWVSHGGSYDGGISRINHKGSDAIKKLQDPKLVLVNQFGKGKTVEVNVNQEVDLLSLTALSDESSTNPNEKPLFSYRIIPAAITVLTREEQQALSPEELNKLHESVSFKDSSENLEK